MSALRSRRSRPARAALALWLALPLLGAPAQAARLVSAQASQADRFGRIVLTFDAPVTVKPSLSGTVLVLGFGEPVPGGSERIATGLPDYVSAVRRDPDGTGLRLALLRPYRVSVQEAGERVYVDLLPESWTGFPPPLPAEVVADLARRAKEAEAALKARAPKVALRTVTLDLARVPGRTRLGLKLPPEIEPAFAEAGGATHLTLAGPWRIDERGARGRLDPVLGRVAVVNDADGARLTATPAGGMSVVTGRDGDEAFVDFVPKVKADKTEPAKLEPAKPEPAKPEPGKPEPARPVEAASPAPAAVQPPVPEAPRTDPVRTPPEAPPRRAGSGLVFPFTATPPAALFERAGIVTAVFETAEGVGMPSPGAGGLVPLGSPTRTGGFVVLRFAAPPGRLVDLVRVVEPSGWELTAGDDLSPNDSLVARRLPGAQGGMSVGLPLAQPGGTVWLDLDGERVAVTTAGGGRTRGGVDKPQRFVDFELLRSRLGVAVLALADDLIVRPDLDGVTIAREAGMAISGPERPAEPPVGAVGDLVIERDAWDRARRGDVRALLRERSMAAVEAPRAQRGPARLALAKALMANDLDVDAVGVVEAAAKDDPVIEADRATPLLRGILAARIGRMEEAARLLASDALASHPEARLWRGVTEGAAGRWSAADAAFRAGDAVLARYPESVASTLHAAAAQAAVELGDWEGAATQAVAAAHGASAETRDGLALLRARIDEATGRGAAALDAYEALAADAVRPVAASAALRAGLLAYGLGRIPLKEALDRLEIVGLTWHGGPTEIETLAALGRLYAEAGRWRQVFTTVRRANILAPQAASTRALHESALSLFEDLFLGRRADRLGGIESLALYFDFKDFAPAGRRADEIVRRLADRLVALDLLESADELLEHQITHRLSGPARASVSARLATIRLMEGKPLDALQTLDTTHGPELPDDLRRARALLRARALSDLSRTDLALETIEGETGADAERLRADILWAARRWREAGEAHEAILGEAWRSGRPLDDAARADVIRAGIAYGLARETLGLERLKAKFAGPMAESADARSFALLTRADAPRNPAFREIAQRATTAETLAAFLTEYRKRYPDNAVPERGKGEGAGEAGTRADGQAPANAPG